MLQSCFKKKKEKYTHSSTFPSSPTLLCPFSDYETFYSLLLCFFYVKENKILIEQWNKIRH